MDSSKRRRLDNPAPRTPRTPIQRSNTNAPARSPIESSSDELAAGSDHDEQRRRTSWTIQKTYPPKRPYPRSRSFSESESSDELAVDAEVYWRSRNRGRSPTQSQSNMSSQKDVEDDEGEGEENEGGDSEAGDAEDDVNEIDEDAHSDRSPTPVPPPPPPPPPKPEKLNYRQKYLLRGHLRGVSAVRFSPDASMLASAGMLLFFFFFFFHFSFLRTRSIADWDRRGWGNQSLGYIIRETHPYIRGSSGGCVDNCMESGLRNHCVWIR